MRWMIGFVLLLSAACSNRTAAALVSLAQPDTVDGVIWVCCEEPREIARIGVSGREDRQLIRFWVEDDFEGPLRFALYYVSGNETAPAEGDAFDPRYEYAPMDTNEALARSQSITGSPRADERQRFLLVVYAENCDWNEARFTFHALEEDEFDEDDAIPAPTEFIFRKECPDEPVDPAPDDDDIIFTVPIPDDLDDPASLITRFGPGDDVTGHAGVLWEDLTTLAGAVNPVPFFPIREFEAQRVRRTADRTQAAFLSSSPFLTGGNTAGTVNFFDTDLFHVDLATGDIRRLTTLRDQGHTVTNFTWSPDGTKIALRVFDATDFSATIRILDVATRTLTEVASFAPISTGLGLSRPVWSPDGSKLAYSFQGNLHVIDLATGNDTRIVEGGPVSDPDWHPTEDRIVYAVGQTGLIIVDSRGAQLQTLPGSDQPEWSWDGTRIAAGAGSGNNNVAIIDVATGIQTILPESDGPKHHDW